MIGGTATLDRLVAGLDAAVQGRDAAGVTQRVKQHLRALSHELGPALPDEFRQPGAECYARRLLHRDAAAGYTAVVMTWGPGQGTPLHDHAGLWCVECVVAGELDVTQFDLVERDGERFRFARQGTVRAHVGDAGCLIPPFEYHVLTNPLTDAVAITLHVYGGEMDRCNAYVAAGTDWWTCTPRRLTYANA